MDYNTPLLFPRFEPAVQSDSLEGENRHSSATSPASEGKHFLLACDSSIRQDGDVEIKAMIRRAQSRSLANAPSPQRNL